MYSNKHFHSKKKFTKILCIHKCTPQKEQKLKFYAFKHAFSFKSKVQIPSETSCIHKCIIQKITENQISCIQVDKPKFNQKFHQNKIFVHSYMHFSKRNKSKVHIQTNFMHCNTQFSKFIFNQNLHAYINAFSRKNR